MTVLGHLPVFRQSGTPCAVFMCTFLQTPIPARRRANHFSHRHRRAEERLAFLRLASKKSSTMINERKGFFCCTMTRCFPEIVRDPLMCDQRVRHQLVIFLLLASDQLPDGGSFQSKLILDESFSGLQANLNMQTGYQNSCACLDDSLAVHLGP